MKRLTERTQPIKAEGDFFKADVTNRSVRLTTDFGSVYIERTRKGLDIHIDANENSFFEQTGILDFIDKERVIQLRAFGAVTMGEMDSDTLREQTQKWLRRNDDKSPVDKDPK